jgi:hypothetical protein
VSPSLIAFSAQFKPYSTDVAVAILLTLGAFGIDAGASRARWIGASLLGVLGPWFSQPAVFLVAGLAAALFGLTLADRPRFLTWPLISLLSVWTISALTAFVAATHRVPREMNLYLRRFWHPTLPQAPMLAFIGLAALLLWLRSPRAAAILLAPVLVTLAAAAAHVYPFQGRTIIFLAPAAILALAEVAAWVVEGFARLRVPRRVAAVVPAAVLVVVIAVDPPPYRDEDARPVLAQVAREWRAGDTMYVLYGGVRAATYYGPLVGLRKNDMTLGFCHRSEPRDYLRDLDRFRGFARVWVFRTHLIGALAEQEVLDGYLTRLGTRIGTIRSEGADATLWDLSDPKLPADAAETQTLPTIRISEVTRLGCGHGPIGVAPWD